MSLFSRLFGHSAPPGDNPVDRWEQRLDRVQELQETLHFADAGALLADLLLDLSKMKGTAPDAFRPVILGRLGECWFESGQADRAIAPTRQALEIVTRMGDAEGITAYLGNLYECHRWLDQPEEAARYAEQLAEHHDRHQQPTLARRYRNQAARVRGGEPLNRVVVEIDGERYELDEVLNGIEGRVRFLFERNKPTLRRCEILVRQGDEEASQGRHEPALALFREAAEADPFAPMPHLESATVLMHLARPADAIEAYKRTEERAPGWFHARAEGWLARQIVLGRYDLQTFLQIRALEDGRLASSARWQLLDRALRDAPDLAILHELHGKVRNEARQSEEAVKAYRRGLACAEEPDIHTRLLVDLAGLLDPGEERTRLLEQAVGLDGNLVAAATARIMLAFP